MKFRFLTRGILSSLLVLSISTSAMPCTVLSYTDAAGNMYVGRTNEYPGMLPDELTYFPVGSSIKSVTPDGKPGYVFKTKYAILGATLKGMVPNANQDTVHDAISDQGMSISALEYTLNGEMKVTGPDDKVLSVLDFATWALGSFKDIAELKQAISSGGLQLWLPRIKSMSDLITPVHFAIWDRSGAGVVVEFTGGKLNIYDNTAGVLANDPEFPWHLTNLNNYAGLTNIDKNDGTFSKLAVSAPDSGGATRSLPASNLSTDRFVKAAYYSSFAERAASPGEAILTLSHVMNNFDRPAGVTIDEPDTAVGETVASGKPTSEVTYFTALRDLSQNHFYLRPITMMNFVEFEMAKLSGLKAVTVVSFDAISKNTSFDGAELFLKTSGN